MSDEVMLIGVLRLPMEAWDDSELFKVQRHARYIQAADLIESQWQRIEQLERRDEFQQEVIVASQARIAELEQQREKE